MLPSVQFVYVPVCVNTVVVGWMTASRRLCIRFRFIPTLLSGKIAMCWPVLAKWVLTYFAFFLLSVTYASSLLSGYRLTLCFWYFSITLVQKYTCFVAQFS